MQAYPDKTTILLIMAERYCEEYACHVREGQVIIVSVLRRGKDRMTVDFSSPAVDFARTVAVEGASQEALLLELQSRTLANEENHRESDEFD